MAGVVILSGVGGELGTKEGVGLGVGWWVVVTSQSSGSSGSGGRHYSDVLQGTSIGNATHLRRDINLNFLVVCPQTVVIIITTIALVY